MRYRLAFVVLFSVLFLAGCALQRLPEDEYARRAVDALRQGRLNDAWAYYRLLLAYYPQSPKAWQYKSQLAEVLTKLVQQKPEHIANGYLWELRSLGEVTDTVLAWVTFQKACRESSAKRSEAILSQMSYRDFMLAAQYAINRMRFKDALSAYEQAIDRFPQNPQVYKAMFLAGFVCSEYLKDFDKARMFYKAVVEKFPNCDLADDAQWMLENMGKPPEEMTFIAPDTSSAR